MTNESGYLQIYKDCGKAVKISHKIRKYNKQYGVKINDMTSLIKNHGNPGYDRVIEECDNIDDLKILRDDNNVSISQLKTIRSRIDICKNLKETDNDLPVYYKGVKKMYIDKGVTVKDCDLTIESFKKTNTLISKRIKELKSK